MVKDFTKKDQPLEEPSVEGLPTLTIDEVLQRDIIRLDLGGGEKPSQGYLNVDIQYYPGVDLILDVAKLDEYFPDNSVDALMCRDTLQCFPFPSLRGILNRWHRVLKPGCRIVLQVHDLEQIYVDYEKGALDVGRFRSLMYGNMRDEYRTYHNCFDRQYLEKLLDRVGFDVQEVLYPELRMKVVAKARKEKKKAR